MAFKRLEDYRRKQKKALDLAEAELKSAQQFYDLAKKSYEQAREVAWSHEFWTEELEKHPDRLYNIGLDNKHEDNPLIQKAAQIRKWVIEYHNSEMEKDNPLRGETRTIVSALSDMGYGIEEAIKTRIMPEEIYQELLEASYEDFIEWARNNPLKEDR